MIRRIQLWGGPNSGKTTTALWLTAELKSRGLSVEYVDEGAKEMALDGVQTAGFDQVLLLGRQMKQEERRLRNGVKHIVTDGPIGFGLVYAERNKTHGAAGIDLLVREFEVAYPSLNLFLDRTGIPFDPVGRFQSEGECRAIDEHVREVMSRVCPYFLTYRAKTERDEILGQVLTHVG